MSPLVQFNSLAVCVCVCVCVVCVCVVCVQCVSVEREREREKTCKTSRAIGETIIHILIFLPRSCNTLQWNPSNPEANEVLRCQAISEVEMLARLVVFGVGKVSCLEVCPQFRGLSI